MSLPQRFTASSTSPSSFFSSPLSYSTFFANSLACSFRSFNRLFFFFSVYTLCAHSLALSLPLCSMLHRTLTQSLSSSFSHIRSLLPCFFLACSLVLSLSFPASFSHSRSHTPLVHRILLEMVFQ